MIDNIELAWSDFKALLEKKNPPHQYLIENGTYTLWFDEILTHYTCHIPHVSPAPEGSDQEDYETNFKSAANFAAGWRPYAFSTSDFEFARKGMFATVNSDDFDMFMKVWDDGLYLNGGTLYCGEGFVFGTWAEMSIVDHENKLGYGVDFELKKWIISSYPSPDGKCELVTPYAGKPPKDLYIRVRIHRVGSETFPAAVNLNFHKAI